VGRTSKSRTCGPYSASTRRCAWTAATREGSKDETYAMKQTKAQTLSWIWAFIVITLGLITTAWIYIVYNNVIKTVYVSSLTTGANPDHMALLNTFIAWAPVAILLGFGVFVIIMSITTRGGDQYVP